MPYLCKHYCTVVRNKQPDRLLVYLQHSVSRAYQSSPASCAFFLGYLRINFVFRLPNANISHHRSAPMSMHRRSSVPYRPANIDQLFNINKGHQQPQHTPANQQLASSNAVATTGLPSNAPTDNDAQQYGNSTAATGDESHALGSNHDSSVDLSVSHRQELHANGNIASSRGRNRATSDSHASAADASAPQSDGPSAHSARLTQAESSSGSRAESATSASPRSVELSDAVQEFLEKPVSGPYRPIFFDLETTGMHLPAVRVQACQRNFSLMLLAVLT